MSGRILLVENESDLVITLCDRLRAEGHHVESAPDGLQGLQRATDGEFNLIILDVVLPQLSGFGVCRELRHRAVETPVLMLTARGETKHRVVGLRLGADDCLVRPFEMAELLARVEARLRRPGLPEAVGPEVFEFGKVRVDLSRAEVRRGGRLVELSPKEYQLLRHFVTHSGMLLSREALLADVWGHRDAVPTRTVDVHVAALRRKLEEHPHQPRFLMTLHGRGYRLTACGALSVSRVGDEDRRLAGG